jgi:NADH-quinone oxidoreductase subunit I
MAMTAPPGIGLLKGLGVTIRQLFTYPSTQMYPKQRPDLPPRTRGVIALMEENCTVCMLCSRECPDWCIYIDSHKEMVPPAKEGGRARTRNVLDRFAIDFSLCMYCGICIEVCPFDALWWSPEFEYAEYDIRGLLHEKDKLRAWADTVPPPPPLDDGADAIPEVAAAIDKATQELELQAAKDAEARDQAAQASAAAAPAGKVAEAEVKVEAGEIDQETYDQLIAEGKSERIARSKAKAAWVKKEKARLRAEQEAAQAAAPAEAPAEAAPDEGAAPAEADAAAAEGQGEQAPTPAGKLADVHVEGAGEIDQETYDRLIAEGKNERIARAKAKAAWVKKRKQELLEQEGGDT